MTTLTRGKYFSFFAVFSSLTICRTTKIYIFIMVPLDIRCKDQLKCVWCCDHWKLFPELPAQEHFCPPQKFALELWSVESGCWCHESLVACYFVPGNEFSKKWIHCEYANILSANSCSPPNKALVHLQVTPPLSADLLDAWLLKVNNIN